MELRLRSEALLVTVKYWRMQGTQQQKHFNFNNLVAIFAF